MTQIAYPSISLLPLDALVAIREGGIKSLHAATIEAVKSPAIWATIAAVWSSKRAQTIRIDYDIVGLAQLFRDLAARKSLARLHRIMAHRGVEPSPQGRRRVEKRVAARESVAMAISALTETAVYGCGARVILNAELVLGHLLRATESWIAFGIGDLDLALFARSKLLDVARALRPMGRIACEFDGMTRTLRFSWRDGRGGLILRSLEGPSCIRDAMGDAIAVVLRPAIAPEPEACTTPQAAVASPSHPIESVEPTKTNATQADSGPGLAKTTDGLTRTQRAWLEYKTMRPIVVQLESDMASVRLISPRAARLLEDARTCKPTSWGSALKRWIEAVRLVRAALATQEAA